MNPTFNLSFPHTPQRLVFIAAGVLILLIFLVALIFGASPVRQEAEALASETLGVAVKIGAVDTERDSGALVLRDLTVANPPGYDGGPAFEIESIRLLFTPDEARPGVLVISEAAVRGGVVNLTVRPDGTNLMALYGLMNSAAGADYMGENGQPLKMIIDRLEMADARLHPVAVQMQDAPVVTLPDIVLRGVGERQDGVLTSVALAFGQEYLLRVAAQAAGQAGFYQGMAPEAVEAMQRQMNLTPGIVEQFRRDMRELGTGLRNLLNNDAGTDAAPPAQ